MTPEPKDEVLASLEELVGLAIMPEGDGVAYARWQEALGRAKSVLDQKKKETNAGLMTPFGAALGSIFRGLDP